jgi:hypothetical protein
MEYRNEYCNHENEQDRCFIGTFVSEDVKLAVSKGYRILQMFEAWHYDSSVYDKNTKSEGIFAFYIDTFFKLKCESSGFPSDVTTEQKRDFIREYREWEGIDLEEETMDCNSGKRALTKMLATCLWGKLSQRNDLQQFEVVQTQARMDEMLNDTTIEVKGVIPVGDETMYVSYKKNIESDFEHSNTNVVLAAFTTAWCRMELFKYLDFLGDRCLYLNTDSVVFRTTVGMSNPETGNFLGDLTCEVEPLCGVGSYISGFVGLVQKTILIAYNVLMVGHNLFAKLEVLQLMQAINIS